MSKIDVAALEEDLSRLAGTGTGPHRCRIQVLVEQHPEATDLLRAAIANTDYSASQVANVLTRRGLEVNAATVQKHRKGQCTVCRKAVEQ